MADESLSKNASTLTIEAELDAIESKISSAPAPSEIAPKEPRLGADSW